jgi:hypothetical protein
VNEYGIIRTQSKTDGQQGGHNMFKAGSSVPKIGEIRLGYVADVKQEGKLFINIMAFILI